MIEYSFFKNVSTKCLFQFTSFMSTSTKYQNWNYTLNILMQKWKIVYQHLNGFIEKQRFNKYLLNNVTNFSPSGAKVLSSYIQKNSLLVGSEGSVLSINVISQSWSNPWWSSLKKMLMEVVLLGKEIYQRLTQHAVDHTPCKIEGKQYTYISLYTSQLQLSRMFTIIRWI